jgi:hypothetical protein
MVTDAAMTDLKTLYEEDTVAWAENQAAALRSAARGRSNQALDWENLAEEIEDLGKSLRVALRSQITRIIHHLIKIEFSPAIDPQAGWRASVREARTEIQTLLEDSPSLQRDVNRYVNSQLPRAIKLAMGDLEDHGEIKQPTLTLIRAVGYTQDQILGDWFPPEPAKE